MGKRTNRHGLIWEMVDRIQTQPDMRKEDRTRGEGDKNPWHLKNCFRL